MLTLYNQEPGRTAVKCKETDYSYGELNRDAIFLRNFLALNNVKRVAIMLPKSPALYAAIWGGYLSGVTVSLINNSYPLERKKRCLNLFSPDIVISEDKIEGTESIAPEDVLMQCPEYSGQFDFKDITLVLFTSGSTGEPKGVKIRRESLEHIIRWCQDHGELRAEDIYGQYSDVSFDMGVCDVFYGFSTGATLVPIDGFEKTMPAELIQKYGITYWYSVPTVLDFMIARKGITPERLGTLRTIGFGGAILYRRHVEMLFHAVPTLHVFNTYGPTEITIFSSYVCMDKDTYGRYATDTVCLGKPVEGMTYEFVDQDGTNKEIIAISRHNFAGYIHSFSDLECTEPIVSFPTRDIVKVENGELFFVSRIDNMVKINGNRVELDEIDLLIRNEYGVPAASVVHNGSIHTFVEDNGRISGAKVRDFLVGRLPVYALPRTIRLIDKIPQTANQKYDRRALLEFIKDF